MLEQHNRELKYIHVNNRFIREVMVGKRRYADRNTMREKLEEISREFTCRHQDDPFRDEDSIELWIFGYGVTKLEEEKGYMGNYATIGIFRISDHSFAFTINKLDIELKRHPRRRRPSNRLPNFGHPLLRDVKSEKKYFTKEQASERLHRMHSDFPESSILSQDNSQLKLQVYSRATTPIVKKYILQVQPTDDNQFVITLSDNTYQRNMIGGKVDETPYALRMFALGRESGTLEDDTET